MGWPTYTRTLAVTFAVTMATALVLIVAMNPYGNLPLKLGGEHAMMDSNRRFHLATALRDTRFDGVIIGTSTAMLLDPAEFDARLGGRFLNAAMENSRAWEQYQAGLLFVRTPRAVKPTLLVGLDAVWCFKDADTNRVTERGFPEWLYDDDPWNDWQWMFNSKALEVAGGVLLHRLGLIGPRIAPNGREVFTPPERDYDAKKAAAYIWQHRKRDTPPVDPPFSPSEAERLAWEFPALAWLDEILSQAPVGSRLVLAWMPIHIASQPVPGSSGAAREAECKRRIRTIADAHGAHVVDFRIPSVVTRDDLNYWDPLHYREPIATRIADGIAAALATNADDPGGFWVYVTGPAKTAARGL